MTSPTHNNEDDTPNELEEILRPVAVVLAIYPEGNELDISTKSLEDMKELERRVQEAKAAIEAYVNKRVMAEAAELKDKMDKLYTELEQQTPPGGLVTAYEREWNDGFYRGQMKALELVCMKVFGTTGDNLQEKPNE